MKTTILKVFLPPSVPYFMKKWGYDIDILKFRNMFMLPIVQGHPLSLILLLWGKIKKPAAPIFLSRKYFPSIKIVPYYWLCFNLFCCLLTPIIIPSNLTSLGIWGPWTLPSDLLARNPPLLSLARIFFPSSWSLHKKQPWSHRAFCRHHSFSVNTFCCQHPLSPVFQR